MDPFTCFTYQQDAQCDPEDNNEHFSYTLLVVTAILVLIACGCALKKHWRKRYRGLRRTDSETSTDSSDSEIRSPAVVKVSSRTMQNLLQEHYSDGSTYDSMEQAHRERIQRGGSVDSTDEDFPYMR